MIKITFTLDFKKDNFYGTWIWTDYLARIVNLHRCISFNVEEVDE